MTDNIDARTAAREAELLAQLEGARRLADPADYVYDKSQEQFWDLKDGTLHGEKSVDASIPIERWRVEVIEPPPRAEGQRGRPAQRRERLIKPSQDIMRVENDQFVEGSTWWPGQPQIIRDWFIDSNGFYPSPGRRVLNTFKPVPEPKPDAATDASPWIEHVKKLWPDETEHGFFFDYCAHMVQCPETKANAAIVLSGTQGIGKDATLYPVKHAVGSWNVRDVDPDQLFSPFQPFLQTLMLVVNEVRPTKDEFHASSMYNILKPLSAAPPMTLPLNDKNAKLRYIVNVLRPFITTNDWMAMYIPPEDRRMMIMHSTLPRKWHEAEGRPDYFEKLWTWLRAGGADAVAAWLLNRDISAFDPSREPPKTVGFEAVSETWGEADDGVAFALDKLGRPDVVFGAELVGDQFDYREEVASMLKSPRRIGHRMQQAGYVIVKNPTGDRWSFRDGDRLFRSRLAFVRSTFAGDRMKSMEMIRRAGKAKVEAPPNSGSAAPQGSGF